jgi:hypothetical protein
VHAVTLEEAGVGLGIGQIVDRNQFQPAIGRSRMARATLRPMRPKPLMATFTAMKSSSVLKRRDNLRRDLQP